MQPEFYNTLQSHGIPTPESSISESRFTRWGDNSRYWAKPVADGYLFGDFKQGISENWFPRLEKNLSHQEIIAKQKQREEERKKAEAELISLQEVTALKAQTIWDNTLMEGRSAYLEKKLIKQHGARFKNNILVIPLYDVTGKIWSLQYINEDGNKRFLADGKKKGCFYLIGSEIQNLPSLKEVIMCEGFATGQSINLATGKIVVVAFDASNLEPVARSLKETYPNLTLVIGADNDWHKEINTGLNKAKELAEKYNCPLIVPEFLDTIKNHNPSDFNDIHVLVGIEEVKAQFQRTLSVKPEIDEIERLAKLTSFEYEKIREGEADNLGVRVTALDKEVIAKRATLKADNKPLMFQQVELWSEPVNAELLLNELVDTIGRFIICEKETAIATSLWIIFTWLVDYVQVAPLAVITAPEMRCGKSQLLNLIGRLSCRPLVASNISPSAMFRVIEAHSPTLLIDEADTFFKENEELRGVVNSGHTRQSAYVIRNVGDDHEPKQFSTWGAKAISGIGSLSDTIKDRAVILELRRKLPSESVQRLRHAESGLFDRLRSQLARLATDAGLDIAKSRPLLPEVLNDRAQDNWEPLLAIADYAGGRWSDIARKTAIKLSGKEQEAVSLSTELLADIHEIFDTKSIERISTAELIISLTGDEMKPWGTYNRGKPISARQLAKRLEEYRVSSKNFKFGYDVKKGYEKEQFKDAFNRYLTHSCSPSELSATPLLNGDTSVATCVLSVAATYVGSATESLSATLKRAENLESSVVALNNSPSGKDMVEVEI